MSQAELPLENSNRPALIKKGRNLEYFTIGYNCGHNAAHGCRRSGGNTGSEGPGREDGDTVALDPVVVTCSVVKTT